MSDQHFQDQVGPITADKRDRVLPATTMRRIVLALDVARENEHRVLPGDFLFADRNSTGSIEVRLNSTGEDAWPVTAQDGVEDVPMRDVFITHAAQAGKVLNLWYGYRARFRAGANSISSIGSILNAVTLAAWIGKNRLYSPGFLSGASVGPVAGQNSFLRLLNPGGSGIRVFLDKLHLGTTPASTFTIRTGAAAGAAFGTAPLPKDGVGAAAAMAQCFSGSAAAVGGVIFDNYDVPANDQRQFIYEEPIILGPGDDLSIVLNTVNQSLRGGFEWREGA